MSNCTHYGMLTGRKIYFHVMTKSDLVDKVKRILTRLDAKIMEFYDEDNINLIIYKQLDLKTSDTEQKSSNIAKFQPKRRCLESCIQNILLNSKINDSNETLRGSDLSLSRILAQAKEKGCKTMLLNDLWQWLRNYYKWLIEIDEPEYSIVNNPLLDEHNHIKFLQCPSMKIYNPFGNMASIAKQIVKINKQMWKEFTNEQLELSAVTEFKRNSTGTSRNRATKNSGVNSSSEYCHMCGQFCKDLYQHINNNQHKLFADNPSNFSDIDSFIAQVPKIEDFFVFRQSLWEKQRQLKISIARLPRSVKQISINQSSLNPDENSVVNFTKLECQEKSSSTSSSSSSYESSSDSSDESITESDSDSSNENNKRLHKNDFISSTPINQKISANFFSPESISADEKQQSQISFHVNEIIDTLDMELCNVEPSLKDLIKSNNQDESPNFARRFDWCKICKRNHVPIESNSFQCHFSPIKTYSNLEHEVDIDSNRDLSRKITSQNKKECFISLNRKFSQEFSLHDNASNKLPFVIERSPNPITEDTGKKLDLSVETIVPKTNLVAKENRIVPSKIGNKNDINLNPIGTENNIKSVENISTKSQNKKCFVRLEKVDFKPPKLVEESKNQCVDMVGRQIYGEEENDSALLPHLSCLLDDCYVEVENYEHGVLNSTSGSNLRSSDGKSKPRTSEDKLNNKSDYQFTESKTNETPLKPAAKNSGNMKPRTTLVLMGDLDPTSPVSGKRKAAISANRGIENTNRFFNTNIKETVRLMEESYNPFVHDPCQILKNLTYSPRSRVLSRKVLRDRNL